MKLTERIKNFLDECKANKKANIERELIESAAKRINIRKVRMNDTEMFAVTFDGVPVRYLTKNQDALEILHAIRQDFIGINLQEPTIVLL